MSKISVAFTINDAYTEHLNIALYSLLKNNTKNQFDIYVVSRTLTQKNQSLIRKTTNHFKNAKLKILELNDQAERFSGLMLSIQHTSQETYYRYILADLFPDQEKILYLDADILVTGDVHGLYDEDIKDFYLAGANDSYIANIDERGNLTKSSKYKELIGFQPNETYVNAGVLLMNLKKIRDDNIISKLFKNTIRLSDTIQFQDQDILNITMQGKIKEVENTFNYTDQDKRDGGREMSELSIIHYTGATKPWKNAIFADFQIPFVELYRNYVDEYNEVFYGSTDKFALYTFSTENIGDDIQAIAARRFLPRVDHYIERDLVGDWKNFDQRENVKMIANGWYMHRPYSWPIRDETIKPLYTSMYIEQSSQVIVDKFLSSDSRKIFKEAGQVGARDESTYEFFRSKGIDAYLSGCVTLTLQKDKNIKKQGFILLTDVSRRVYEFVRASTKREVIYLTNAINTSETTIAQREELAEIYLYLYQSAHCVITERLHTALPCLALETPVLLLKKSVPVGGNKDRFSGLGGLAHYHTEDEFINDGVYDTESPPPNPEEYLDYREKLVAICQLYTGYCDEHSFTFTDIGKKTFTEVASRLEFLKETTLREASTVLMQVRHEHDILASALAEKQELIARQGAEIDRLMGIKASTRRLVGNIRRRATGIVKDGK